MANRTYKRVSRESLWNVCIVQFSSPGISGVLEEVHANNLHLFPKGNTICDMQTCLSRLPRKQNWCVHRTWKTRPVLQILCWNGLQCLHESGGTVKCGEVPTHLGKDKVLVQPKFTCLRSMLCINQEKPLFQLEQDFRTSKLLAASDIGGLSKRANISIIQVLEGLFWDLKFWIESAIAWLSILTLLEFESLQSHWPTLVLVWASFHRFFQFRWDIFELAHSDHLKGCLWAYLCQLMSYCSQIFTQEVLRINLAVIVVHC